MKTFKKIYLEITNQCNLTCDFCPSSQRKSEKMTVDTFNSILDKIQGYTKYLYFHVKGEPLLHPELETFLTISERKGFKVHITTNGTLISSKRKMLIKQTALRQINFSLHSFWGNTFCNPVKDYLDPIIDFTKEAINKSPVIISYRLWNYDEGVQTSKNETILAHISEAFHVDIPLDKFFHSGKGFKLADRVYLNQEYPFHWPDRQGKVVGYEGYCYGLKNQIGILVDGTVIPCCLDAEGAIDLGNIKEESLEMILNHKRTKAIIDGFSKRKIVEELCAKCDFRKRFDKH